MTDVHHSNDWWVLVFWFSPGTNTLGFSQSTFWYNLLHKLFQNYQSQKDFKHYYILRQPKKCYYNPISCFQATKVAKTDENYKDYEITWKLSLYHYICRNRQKFDNVLNCNTIINKKVERKTIFMQSFCHFTSLFSLFSWFFECIYQYTCQITM